MKVVFKIMIFSIILNFAVGIMQTAIPQFADNPENLGGLQYDPNYVDTFGDLANQSVNPSAVSGGVGTDESRLWDRVGLGKITQMLNAVPRYVFGFVNVLENLFGNAMDAGLRTIVFGGLRSLMLVGYALGAFWLWTGKSFIGK